MRKGDVIGMTGLNNLLYSTQFGERARHVIIDGVCVKSRTSDDLNPDVEKAVSEYDDILLQEGREIKIYAREGTFDFYKKMVEVVEEDDGSTLNRLRPSVSALKSGDVKIFTEKHKDGYKF